MNGLGASADARIGFVLPQWVGGVGLLAIMVGASMLGGVAWERYRHRRAA